MESVQSYSTFLSGLSTCQSWLISDNLAGTFKTAYTEVVDTTAC
jgi:hypothetical protein